ncbi:MAG TPA: 16S rRNA (cytidine(1402)-2'-O)-methyltransferase [Acidimicrobiales bacterium]|nr:16S rRNA (cytidine(1402)-2'-O)-methyltransferase [Acidimicrobiales bacterium]
MSGALVVVATPIGNLGDLSPRAVDALAGADAIACEDTRHTRKLLTHAGISGIRLLAVHGENEGEMGPKVAAMVAAGKRVALVTDAGTPAVSDPGQRIVAAVLADGGHVEVVPGPSAVVAALVASGLPTDRFCFEGFLPRKGSARARQLAAIASEPRTTVIYEAANRAATTLADLAAACGSDRPAALARELTKVHEEVRRGTLGRLAEQATIDPPKGECVLVVGGAPPAEPAGDDEIALALQREIDAGADRRTAVASVMAATGAAKNRVYEISLGLTGSG